MIETPVFNLYLIRHGQSERNLNNTLIGQPDDCPLTKAGVAQARLLYDYFQKQHIEFDYAFSSPYTRAKNTANLTLPFNKIMIQRELREYSSGDYLNKERIHYFTDDVKEKFIALGNDFHYPNGESMNEVKRRISYFFDKFILNNVEITNLSKTKEVNIAVFSHCLAIKCALQYILNFDTKFIWNMMIDNTSFSRLTFNNGWQLNSINETPHLI